MSERTHWVECTAGAMFDKFNRPNGVTASPDDSPAVKRLIAAIGRIIEEKQRKQKA